MNLAFFKFDGIIGGYFYRKHSTLSRVLHSGVLLNVRPSPSLDRGGALNTHTCFHEKQEEGLT